MLLKPCDPHKEFDIDIDRIKIDIAKTLNAEKLIAAIYENDLDKIKTLLNIDINIEFKGKYPIFAAIESGNYEIVKYIISNATIDFTLVDSWGDSLIHSAIKHGNESLIDLLLKQDLNCTDKWGDTVLHSAIKLNKLSIIPILLEHGADPHIKDQYGFTIHDYAIQNNYHDIIKLLADIEGKNIDTEFANFIYEDLTKHEEENSNILDIETDENYIEDYGI